MYTCTIADKTIKIEDLPAGIYSKVAEEAGLKDWTDLFLSPIKNLTAGSLLYQKIAEYLKVEPANPITIKVLVDAFKLDKPEDESDDGGSSSENPSEADPGDGS